MTAQNSIDAPVVTLRCFSNEILNTSKEKTRHKHFELIWLKTVPSGTLVRVDHEVVEVEEGGILLISIGQVLEISQPVSGISITLTSAFFQQVDNRKVRIVFNPFFNEPTYFKESNEAFLSQVISLLKLEQNSGANNLVMEALVRSLLIKISTIHSALNLPEENSERIRKIFHIVEENFLIERNASFYADQVGLSTKRLNQVLQAKIGMTITQLLHRILLTEAKKRLINDEKSIQEIAYALGFTEQGYFTRFFKKHIGQTPEAFIKAHRS